MADEEARAMPEGQPSGGVSDHHMLADLWRDHKTPIMVVIAGATMLLTAVLVWRANSSASGASGTPASGTNSSAGVPTAQTVDSTQSNWALTTYLQSILQALQSNTQSVGGGSTSSTTTTSGGGMLPYRTAHQGPFTTIPITRGGINILPPQGSSAGTTQLVAFPNMTYPPTYPTYYPLRMVTPTRIETAALN